MPTDFQTELQHWRTRMIDDQLRRRSIVDEAVLRAMQEVPRHEFVPWELQREAYNDTPVPIGEGQTISQPFIVAHMLQSLRLSAQDRVLEVGTGTGYEAAVMSRIVDQVYTIERFATLADRAQEIFTRFGYENIRVIVGDGSAGYPPAAPYDCIVVAAAAPDVPPALIDQLKGGGRMVVPVGPADLQQLVLLHKIGGQVQSTSAGACRFVPLVGAQGYAADQ